MSNEITTLEQDAPFAGTVINVKHLCAKGDGETDDTKCPRAAIAA